MKLNCKSIGYYRRSENWFRGPLIINSNNFYQLGDNFVIKYIGAVCARHVPTPSDDNSTANPTEFAYDADTMHQMVETPPVHIRYYTIAKENPITIIYETVGPDEDIIISFKILSADSSTDCQILKDRGNGGIMPNKRIILIDCNQPIKIEKFGIDDLWENTNQHFFYIDESPLIRLTIPPRRQHNNDPICMIVELSAPFFYFNNDITEMSMTDIVESLVSTAIESAVQEAIDDTANNS